MNLRDASIMVGGLMRQHGLFSRGWRFRFDRAKTRFGCCRFLTKTITMSSALIELNEEARVRNTALHEIAHAIAGAEAGHGPKWVRIATELGCDAQRCYHAEKIARPPAPLRAVCPNGHSYEAFRQPRRRRSCGICSRNNFDVAFVLNYIPVDNDVNT